VGELPPSPTIRSKTNDTKGIGMEITTKLGHENICDICDIYEGVKGIGTFDILELFDDAYRARALMVSWMKREKEESSKEVPDKQELEDAWRFMEFSRAEFNGYHGAILCLGLEDGFEKYTILRDNQTDNQ